MKSIINMAWMHLTLIFQDRATYGLGLGVPVVLMTILSLAISEGNFVSTIPVDIVDQDQSGFSTEFIDILRQTASSGDSDALVFCVYGTAEIPDGCGFNSEEAFENIGADRLTNQNVAAAVIIPTGFGAAL